MKALTVQQMVQIGRAALEKYGNDYDYIGVRVQDYPEEIGGQMVHQSHVWDDGEDTGEKLPGVSAINANDKHISPHTLKHCYYMGDYVLILGSYRIQQGTDEGEIIMIDPVVLDCQPLND